MLKFTPREIQKQEFKKVIRGFDTVEVETFLEMVSDEFELLLRTKNDLQEKVTKYGTELEKYKEVEGSLQETLVEAKRTSTQSLEASKREAETILREAESKAQKIIEDAHREANQLRDEIGMLKKQRESFVRRLKEWLRVLELDEIVRRVDQEKRQMFLAQTSESRHGLRVFWQIQAQRIFQHRVIFGPVAEGDAEMARIHLRV